MNKKRINVLLIANNDLNNSGVPSVIYQIIKLLHNDYNFDIMVFGNDLYFYHKLINEDIDNVNVITINSNKPKSKFGRLFYWFFTNPNEMYKKTKEVLSSKKYQIVHCFKEYFSWPFLKAAKKAKISKRIVHSNVIHDEKMNLLLKRNRRKTIKYSTNLIGVTRDCCEYAYKNNNYQVIHFSYDEQRYNYSERDFDNCVDLVLTQVATFSANKNQLFLLDIFNEVLKRYSNSSLVLVGYEKDRGYLEKMNNFINENHLNEMVKIIDGSKGASEYIKNTTFLVITSIKEGASLVAVEAQACGVKVFASSSVPKEMNLGGITFVDLKEGADYWADCIVHEFKKIGNKRTVYPTNSFSSLDFKQNLIKLYDNENS